MNSRQGPICQGCGEPLSQTLVDLGLSPLANSYVAADTKLDAPISRYPLHARVCSACLLVQVDSVVPREEIFSDYAYFSSYSDSWLAHCKSYADTVISRFKLGPTSRVVEIASNDGYLLQYFVERGIPSLGVDPAKNIAEVARARGIPTEVAFFGTATAKRLRAEGYATDLLAAKNVLAHVPDINDFVEGIKILLKPEGVFTVEFPHLLNLIRDCQFDTIYHEHYTYLSFLAVEKIFGRHGIRIFDVEEVSTHGGSLRVFACHIGASYPLEPGVDAVRGKELAALLDRPEGYVGFQVRAEKVRDDLLAFLHDVKRHGKIVIGYGAAAKGNTLLNFGGIDARLLPYVVDRSKEKQGRLLPGSRIPVVSPEMIDQIRPDYILILPWNLKHEIMTQLTHVREWSCRFVTSIPALSID